MVGGGGRSPRVVGHEHPRPARAVERGAEGTEVACPVQGRVVPLERMPVAQPDAAPGAHDAPDARRRRVRQRALADGEVGVVEAPVAPGGCQGEVRLRVATQA
jgi:hypothetical protein